MAAVRATRGLFCPRRAGARPGLEQSYNAQAAVDIGSRLLVSQAVSDAPNDKEQLGLTLAAKSNRLLARRLQLCAELLAKCRELVHHLRDPLAHRLGEPLEVRGVALAEFAEGHDDREVVVNPVL